MRGCGVECAPAELGAPLAAAEDDARPADVMGFAVVAAVVAERFGLVIGRAPRL